MSKNTEKILVILFDFIFINLAWMVFFYIRVESGLFQLITMPEEFVPMLVVYFYWLLIFTFVGMYRTWFAASRFDELSTLFKATFVGIFILFLVIFIDDYLHGVESSSRILIFIYWGLLLFFVSVGRLTIRGFQRRLLVKGIGRRCAVIVGYNLKAKEVHDQVSEHPALGLDVKAYAAVNPNNVGKFYKGTEVTGTVDEIEKLVDEAEAKEVIIALEKEDHNLLVNVISKLEHKQVG